MEGVEAGGSTITFLLSLAHPECKVEKGLGGPKLLGRHGGDMGVPD